MARLADIPVNAAPEVIALGDKALEQMLTAKHRGLGLAVPAPLPFASVDAGAWAPIASLVGALLIAWSVQLSADASAASLS